MITRIEIDGFKSFDQFAIDLKPLHVLIGPNGGGKSNLFEALNFMSTLITRDVRAAAELPIRGRLPDLFRKTPDGPVNKIRFAVEMATRIGPESGENGAVHADENGVRLRYEIELRKRAHEPNVEITSEIAALSPAVDKVSERQRALVRPPAEAFLEASTGTSLEMPESDVPEGFRSAYDLRGIPVSSSRTYLSTFLDDGTDNENLSVYGHLYRALSRVQIAPFSADALRRAADPATLMGASPHSYRIPEALADIQKRSSYNVRAVRRALLSLIPDVSELRIDHDAYEDRHRVYVEWVDGTKTALPQLSDGTLRALALVTMAHDPECNGLVMIEEPENGVHPGRLKQLTRYYRMLAESEGRGRARQCLISTHSPILLKYLMQVDGDERKDATPISEDLGITLITTALQSQGGRASVGLTVDPSMTYDDRTRERAGEVHAFTQLIEYLEEGDLPKLVENIKSSFEPETA